MNEYIKEVKIKIFDIDAIRPGDVVQFYSVGGNDIRTETENGLVVSVAEREMSVVVYDYCSCDSFTKTRKFRPDDRHIVIENVIKNK